MPRRRCSSNGTDRTTNQHRHKSSDQCGREKGSSPLLPVFSFARQRTRFRFASPNKATRFLRSGFPVLPGPYSSLAVRRQRRRGKGRPSPARRRGFGVSWWLVDIARSGSRRDPRHGVPRSSPGFPRSNHWIVAGVAAPVVFVPVGPVAIRHACAPDGTRQALPLQYRWVFVLPLRCLQPMMD